MADASRTVDIIFKGTNEIAPAVASIETDLNRISDGSIKAANDVNASTDKINTAFAGTTKDASTAANNVELVGKKAVELDDKPVAAVSNLTKNMSLLGAAVGTALVGAFIAINAKVEDFTRSIDFATGETGRGVTEFDYLVDASNRLGISVLGAADSYADLVAATQDGTLSTSQVRAVFEAITGSISAMGKEVSVAAGILDKIGDAVADGVLSFQELEQITQELPGGLSGFASAIGVPVEALKDLAKEGKLTNVQLLAYADTLNNKLSGTSTDNFTAANNRLKNAIVELNVDLAKTGGFDVFVDGAKFATLSLITSIGYVTAFGEAIGLVIAALATQSFGGLGDDLADSWNKANAQASTAWDTFQGIEGTTKDIDAANQSLGRSNGDLWHLQPLTAYAGALDEVSEKTAKTALELEKLASNERIKSLEFAVKLEIAGIEANAKKVVAAFDSISSGIKSARELLGKLFGELNDSESISKRFAIEDQIALTNERLDKELALQEKLAEATIRESNARTARLKAGDAVVTINGDGLQPHLEAFMWEILEKIQTRVNADGLDMLLGVA